MTKATDEIRAIIREELAAAEGVFGSLGAAGMPSPFPSPAQAPPDMGVSSLGGRLTPAEQAAIGQWIVSLGLRLGAEGLTLGMKAPPPHIRPLVYEISFGDCTLAVTMDGRLFAATGRERPAVRIRSLVSCPAHGFHRPEWEFRGDDTNLVGEWEA